jgi:hypothetical protein
MSATNRAPKAQTAIRMDLGAIFVSLELSRTTWLLTSLSPGGGERMAKFSLRSGDVVGLRTRFVAGFGFNESKPGIELQAAIPKPHITRAKDQLRVPSAATRLPRCPGAR